MKYSKFLNRFSKRIFRIGVFLQKSSIILIVLGLILGILKVGWLILFIGFGVLILSFILVGITTSYLSGYIRLYVKKINYKEANVIAHNHLKEPIELNNDTGSFINEIIGTEGKCIKRIRYE